DQISSRPGPGRRRHAERRVQPVPARVAGELRVSIGRSGVAKTWARSAAWHTPWHRLGILYASRPALRPAEERRPRDQANRPGRAQPGADRVDEDDGVGF